MCRPDKRRVGELLEKSEREDLLKLADPRIRRPPAGDRDAARPRCRRARAILQEPKNAIAAVSSCSSRGRTDLHRRGAARDCRKAILRKTGPQPGRSSKDPARRCSTCPTGRRYRDRDRQGRGRRRRADPSMAARRTRRSCRLIALRETKRVAVLACGALFSSRVNPRPASAERRTGGGVPHRDGWPTAPGDFLAGQEHTIGDVDHAVSRHPHRLDDLGLRPAIGDHDGWPSKLALSVCRPLSEFVSAAGFGMAWPAWRNDAGHRMIGKDTVGWPLFSGWSSCRRRRARGKCVVRGCEHGEGTGWPASTRPAAFTAATSVSCTGAMAVATMFGWPFGFLAVMIGQQDSRCKANAPIAEIEAMLNFEVGNRHGVILLHRPRPACGELRGCPADAAPRKKRSW